MKKILNILNIFLLLTLICCIFSIEKDYTDFVNYLKQEINENSFKGSAYKRLAYITDTYGPRMWGSSSLQMVIQQMKKYAQEQNFQNIRLDPVSNFTKWVRGKQQLILHSPRTTPTKLAITALGGSVSGNFTAQVLVVQSFPQLQSKQELAKGKIIVFNYKWTDYSSASPYRVDGASIAAKFGAIAMLVRSLASESIYSVHTGYMIYDPQYPKIPCAAITVQDSEMFQRMQKRGQNITLQLLIETQFVSNTLSYNLIFEIMGSQKPQQIVLAGGHIDTWDTGSQTGANDDGGGFITVFQAFRMLKRLGFRPKRTLRFIAWSGQQSGSLRDGSNQYLQRHLKQIDKHVAAFQNDQGSTRMIGFGHSGPGQTIVQQILARYMPIIGAQKYSNNGWSADVQNLLDHGVPIIHQLVEDTPDNHFYYKFHHTAGDSMTIMNPDDMDSNVLGIAAFLFIIADLQNSLRKV